MNRTRLAAGRCFHSLSHIWTPAQTHICLNVVQSETMLVGFSSDYSYVMCIKTVKGSQGQILCSLQWSFNHPENPPNQWLHSD